MNIREWLDKHDPFFQQPTKALAAGFSLAALAAEYERVFESEAMAAYHMANDIREWSLTEQ